RDDLVRIFFERYVGEFACERSKLLMPRLDPIHDFRGKLLRSLCPWQQRVILAQEMLRELRPDGFPCELGLPAHLYIGRTESEDGACHRGVKQRQSELQVFTRELPGETLDLSGIGMFGNGLGRRFTGRLHFPSLASEQWQHP